MKQKRQNAQGGAGQKRQKVQGSAVQKRSRRGRSSRAVEKEEREGAEHQKRRQLVKTR